MSTAGGDGSTQSIRASRRFGVLGDHAATILLVLLFALLVATPFIEMVRAGEVLESVLGAAIFLMGVVALGARKGSLGLAIALVIPTIATRAASHLHPSPILKGAYAVLAFAFLALIAGHLLLAALRAHKVTRETVCAALASYLMIGTAWSLLYRLVALVDPHAFTLPAPEQTLGEFESVYYSFVTLVGLGYGDITPVAPVARMLAVVEALVGLLFVATLISRLVGAFTSEKDKG